MNKKINLYFLGGFDDVELVDEEYIRKNKCTYICNSYGHKSKEYAIYRNEDEDYICIEW